MKPIHRPIVGVLLAWLLMFALPFAGHASVRLPAAPAAQAAHAAPAQGRAIHAQGCPHGGRAGMANAGASGHAAADAHERPAADHDGKSASCSACCIGAALSAGMPAMPVLERPVSAAIPFFAPHVPSGFAALPERPPQDARA